MLFRCRPNILVVANVPVIPPPVEFCVLPFLTNGRRRPSPAARPAGTSMHRIFARFVPMLLALPSVAPAADPLADTVRDAVAARNLRETALHGNATARSPYRDGASD